MRDPDDADKHEDATDHERSEGLQEGAEEQLERRGPIVEFTTADPSSTSTMALAATARNARDSQ